MSAGRPLARRAAIAGRPSGGARRAPPRLGPVVLTRFGVAAALALVPVAWLAVHFHFLSDDAFISFRYARHLAEGSGLRFNLGAEPPVEGYSNFLWVLWIAAGMRLGLAPWSLATATSVLCALALAVLVARRARERLGLGPLAAASVALVLGTLPPFAVWATSGLAAMPAALLAFLCWDRLLGDPERPRGLQAGAAAAGLALLRADGAGLALVVLAIAAVSARVERRRALARATGRAALLLVACVAAHTLFRVAYHGDFVPNTARVKAGPSALRLERGALYVASFLAHFPAVLAILAAAPLAARGRSRRVVLQASAFVAAVLGYAAFVGGDFMAMGRFLVPALPFVGLLLAAELRALGRRGRSGRALGAAAVAGCLALSGAAAFDRWVAPRAWREALHFRWTDTRYQSEWEVWRNDRENTRSWRTAGRALAAVTNEGESMILGAIGAVGYHSRLEIHDLYGLVDREVARLRPPVRRASAGHDKTVEPEFFFPRRPTYLFFVVSPADAPLDPAHNGVPARLRRMVTVEPHPLPPRPDRRETELRLLRLAFPTDEELDEAVGPLVAAAAAVDPSEPLEARARLETALSGAEAERVDDRLRELARAGEIANVGVDPPFASLLFEASGESFGLEGRAFLFTESGAPHRLRRGGVRWTLPLDPELPLEGDLEPGWAVLPPGTVERARVLGGPALVVLLALPGSVVPAKELR